MKEPSKKGGIMKKVTQCSVIAVFLLLTSISFAESVVMQAGLKNLTTTQNPDGSWGNETSTTEILPATVSVIETLQALNQTDIPKYSNAVLWLQSQGLDTTEYLSERIYALSVEGTDLNLLLSYIDQVALAWGGYESYWVNNLDTVFALNALKKINYSDQNVIYPAINYLKVNQNADGGWGSCASVNAGCGDGEADSSAYMTALVLYNLSQFKSTYDLQTEINKAVAYLLTKQNPDGSFPSTGSGQGTVYETALAFDSLISSGSVGAENYAVLQNAIAYLTSTQLPNGSWNDDPYSTALALRALANVKPNLSITSSDITFSNLTPTVGETITITANIKNTGLAQADNVSVQFYEGEPGAGGILIGETTIATISQNVIGAASIAWISSTTGIHNIFVFADPENIIEEQNESDNLAIGQARIYEKIDLTVQGITFIPELPSPGQSVDVQVKVANMGGLQTDNVVVRLSSDSVLIEDKIITTLGSLQVQTLTFTLQNLSNGIHQITATVDPENSIAEGNETNSAFTKPLEIKDRVDLIASTSSIYFSNSTPKEGEIIYMAAVIHNSRENTANNVNVRFYDADPNTGGTQIGEEQTIATIPGGGTGQTDWLSYDTFERSGTHSIYVVVDPMNTVDETDELNNAAMRSIEVQKRSDLIIQDIQFTPLSPEEGDLVQIKAVVKNIGSYLTEGTKLKFYLGDPSSGGAQIGIDLNIGTINPNATVTTSNITFNTAERLGDNPIFAVVDPFNTIDEIIETNNTLNKTLAVAASTRPDLTLTSSDISFNPAKPVIGDAITISARISNLRNTPASNVGISFFDGDPASGGILLGNTAIPDMGGMATGNAEITWDAAGITGKHTIYITIDPDNLISEANEANNEAFVTLKICLPQGAAPINLTATPINTTDIELNWEPGPEAEAYGIIGYNIYRNNILVNSLRDISKEGTASASSTYSSYTPNKAIDANISSHWRAAYKAILPQWWQEDFASQRKIKKVAIYWQSSHYAKDFEIQTWDGTQWITQLTVTGNNKEITAYEFPTPVITGNVRIYITSVFNSYYPGGIVEVDIYEDRLIEALNYQDKGLGTGTYTYYATAVDADDAESLPSNEAAASLGDSFPPASPAGLTASVSGFNINLSWSANTEPDLSGYRVYEEGLNVANRGRGAIIIGSNGSSSFDSVIDGNPASTSSYILWDTTPHGTMTVILPKVYEIEKIRLLLFEGNDNRFYRYMLESSTDGVSWHIVADKTTGEWQGWQEEIFAQPIHARYFRITGTFCSTDNYFRVSEFEAYTPEIAPVTLDTTGGPSFGVSNYSNFYEYIYDWNSGSRQPRRFVFSEFNTEENDILSIYDKDTGVLLANYSGNLGPFITPPLTATNYRFQFITDYEGTGSGFDIANYIISGKQTGRTFSETIYENGNYRHAVTAIDTNGNESALSTIVTAIIADVTPPATPKNLAVKAGNGIVELTWTENTEPELAGYNLYRNGELTPLNGDSLLTAISYEDLNVNNLTTYTYQITAVDVNGNESAKSIPLTATPSGIDLSGSITFFPFLAQKNETVEISALIKNQGIQDAANEFKVNFYKGDPNAGGVLIGSKIIAGLLVEEVSIVSVAYIPIEFINEIFIVIDPDDSIKEYDEINNKTSLKLIAYDNLKTLYTTYVYTLKDLMLFGYKDNAQISVFDANQQQLLWSGTLNNREHLTLSPGAGIYKIYGSQPYTIITGDPTYLVMGYYALDERNLGLSKNFDTYMVKRFGPGSKFIVFAYEDDTEVQIINSETNAVIWSGLLNKGQHYENGVEEIINAKFLRVISSKPVSGLSYADQGYYIPSENGTFFGKLFYTYAGFVGNWPEDLNVIAYENNTRIIIKNTDTGQVLWEGVLNEGEVHSENILGYYTVEADKKITAGVFPFKSYTGGYYHLAVSYDPTGTGVGTLFYVPAIDSGPEHLGSIHIFSYQDDNEVKVTDWWTKNVVWEGLLNAGEFTRIDTIHTVYKIESSKFLSAIESYGDRAGADFVPTYYAAATDLEAYKLEILPDQIYPGDNSLISATISNHGDTYQEDIIAEVYIDDLQIDTAILSLEPHTAKEMQINWQAIEGNHLIKVIVDPQDAIIEQNELNNVISLMRVVSYPQPPSVMPNLTIASSDITFSKSSPYQGENLTINAAIHNTGTDASNILVLTYLGNPMSGGIQLGATTVPNLPSNGTTTVQTQWLIDKPAGTYDIYIWTDPYNTIPEENENDNIAFKNVTVREQKVSAEVTTDKTQYQANSDVGVSVLIKNIDALSWSGTGEVYIEDTSGNQVAHVGTFTVNDLKPTGITGWKYRIPLPVTSTWDMKDILAEADIDFTQILAGLGIPDKIIDKNSIRVLEFDGIGNFKGEKQARAVFETDTIGKVICLVDGSTAKDTTRYFYIYFDTTDTHKEPSSFTKLPLTGKLIAFSDDIGKFYVLESNGDGTFGSPRQIDDVSTAKDYTRGIVLDDFNNDGSLDIISGDAHGEIYYYQNRADGLNTFNPKIQISAIISSTFLMGMVAADFNNDGNKDFVASGNTSNLLYLFTGNGDGTFIRSNIPATGSNYFRGKAAADVNNDNKTDLIVANTSGVINLYKGNGDGTFLSPVQIVDIGNDPYGLVTDDFNEDGKIDIIANNSSTGDAYLLKGNGSGTFMTPSLIPSLDSGNLTAFDTGDFNNDGHVDVITATYSSRIIEFYPGNGDGTFGLRTIITITTDDSLGISASPALTEIHLPIGIAETVPSLSYSFIWNTGSTPPGNYKVHVTLSEGQGVITEDYTSFEILPDVKVDSTIIPDKVSYNANEPVTITSTVTSLSKNAFLENLTAIVTITNGQGTALFTENNNIPLLTPGGLTEFSTYWNTTTNPPGDYPVILEVKDASSNVLSTSSAILAITGEIKPSRLLTGEISVDRQSILQGEPVAITYGITNIGNINLPGINLSIPIVHVVELTPYDTLTDHTALLMGGTYANTQTLNTQNYSAKDYLVILRAEIQGVEATLASAYFRVEGAPSAPSLNWPSEAEDIETLTPSLTVNNAADPNDDDLTYEFELYSDSGLANLLSSSDMMAENQNTTSWTPSTGSGQAILEENSRYYWRARAYDGLLYGDWMTPASFRVNLTNEPPTAPTLSSPADDSDVDTLTPLLVVNNSFDPDSDNLTYNFELALDIDFARIISSQIGIFEGEGTTSWQVSVTLTENTYYYWRAQADDWLIEGPWMIPAGFFINTANDAPTAPVIIYPSDGSEITTLYTDVTVQNSTDPDSENLTYVFEIDTANTFDSPDYIISGSIPEGQGTTSWHPSTGSGEPLLLQDNTFYFVRAKASDGLAESPWSEVVSFFVNTLNDPPTTPVLSNPSDGSGVNTFTPDLSVHNSYDIDGDVLTYEFELYDDAAMSNPVSVIAGVIETLQVTSWTVPLNLTENKNYFWRARAFDGELYSGWMPPASFMVNTANDAPSAPILHSPAEGSSVDTLNPTLSVHNAIDPDSDILTYDFEIYSNGLLIKSITGVHEDISAGITSITLSEALSDNTTYRWRTRAYDGDRYGAWMNMASFSIHLPVTNITGTIDFDPDTLNQGSQGKWVVAYIELPQGYNVPDIIVSSILLEGSIPAEPWPYSIGDHDKDGIPDLMVKFNRANVINLLPAGEKVIVHLKGTVGTTTFEGFDIIRVIH